MDRLAPSPARLVPRLRLLGTGLVVAVAATFGLGAGSVAVAEPGTSAGTGVAGIAGDVPRFEATVVPGPVVADAGRGLARSSGKPPPPPPLPELPILLPESSPPSRPAAAAAGTGSAMAIPPAPAPTTTTTTTTPPPPLLAPPASPPAAPAATPAGAAVEAEFLAGLNRMRADVGVPGLIRDAELDRMAADWSAQMAASGVLRHSGMIQGISNSRGVPVGENVGRGPSVGNLLAAFQASSAHHENLVSGMFVRVGIATAVGPDGTMWTTHVFAG